MADWRDSHWYRRAEGKPPGYRFRTWHEDCTSQPHMQVSVSREGVSAYCHKCKESMFVPAAQLSLAEKAASLAAQEATDKGLQRDKGFPLPKTENPSEWPLDARVWLYEAGISNHEIIEQGVYYHAPSNRVIIPVRDGTRATGFWQGRSVSGVPKYINPAGFNRQYIVGHFLPAGESAGVVILCEDWKSAYRVNRATGLRTFALLGTTLSDAIAARLCNSGEAVYVWLDNDEAGRTACAGIMRKLRAFDIASGEIHTPLDPKKYDDDEIVEIVNEQLKTAHY